MREAVARIRYVGRFDGCRPGVLAGTSMSEKLEKQEWLSPLRCGRRIYLGQKGEGQISGI